MNSKPQEFFIIGHRGAAGEQFENSMSGFGHALTLDIDAIELDIQEHDGHFWVFHDAELDRLTTGCGLLSKSSDLSAIQLNNGEPIPTLPQVLDLLWGNMAINIEIKHIHDCDRLLQLLDGYPEPGESDSFPPLLISSFNHRVLVELSALDCPWPIAPISYGVPAAVDQLIIKLQPWSWHFDDEYVDFSLVSELMERGIQSYVYTVNHAERATQLRDNGVKGIFTDLPGSIIPNPRHAA